MAQRFALLLAIGFANYFAKKEAPPFPEELFHDPCGIRTRVTAVKGRCLNPLTNGPGLPEFSLVKKSGRYRARTCDPLLVRQMLSQLS